MDHVDQILEDLQKIYKNMGALHRQASSCVTVSHVLTKVHHIMAPRTLRGRLQWVQPQGPGDMSITTDPFLFEICLLALCKDMVGFVYDGGKLMWSLCEKRLCLTIAGECVDKASLLLGDTIDIGFMQINRNQLSAILRELGMVLSQTSTSFELSFSSSRESLPHGNIIPLFA